MDFVEIIKKTREEKGFSQKAMADILGIARTTYADIESRKIRLSTEDFEKLCSFLGLSPTMMLNPEKKVFEMTEDEFELIKETKELLTKIINEVNNSNPTVSITGDKNKVIIHGMKVNKK